MGELVETLGELERLGVVVYLLLHCDEATTAPACNAVGSCGKPALDIVQTGSRQSSVGQPKA